MNLIKRNIIELSIFFVFLLYFSAWFIFNNDNVVINNDELSYAINYYNFTPHLSNFLNELIQSKKLNLILGSILFPSLCAAILYKIFYKILQNTLWSVSLTLLSILSSESFPFINFLKSVFTFSDLYNVANRSENFEIIGFPIPSFSIFCFLITFYYSNRVINLNKSFIFIATSLWLINTHIHPLDGLLGLSYWTIFVLITVFLKKISFSLKEILSILLMYVCNFVLLFINFEVDTLTNINPEQNFPLYSLLFYFISPMTLIILINIFFKVDLYEFFIKFFPIYILMVIELCLIGLSLMGYGVDLQMLENRISLFLLHFLYYVPAIYYLNKDSIFYENSLEKNIFFSLLKKSIYNLFSKYKAIYLVPFSILLITYAYLSLNI